ncbi:MAG: divalent-cation tolerance protein CutA [Burkholderiales bacterium]|nr:divalent-cation tolerance protein CutA [Burkholderiales bacterium]
MSTGETSDHLVVLTNLPDRESAHALALHLLQLRLVACVNVLAPCQSMYHWQEKIETANEVPMLIKAVAANYPAIEAAIREKHPYEVPEIIAVPISSAYKGYLDWINAVSPAKAAQQLP